MRYLVPAGGTAVFLLLMMTVLFVHAPPAAAQEADAPEQEGFVETVLAGGAYTYPTVLLLAGAVAATAAGLFAAKRPDAWPLWPSLVRGLGDAGFLLAIIGTFAGLREAMLTIARLGAALTPADLAAGFRTSLTSLAFGACVALAGLLGAALVRWRLVRTQPPAPRVIAEKFS